MRPSFAAAALALTIVLSLNAAQATPTVTARQIVKLIQQRNGAKLPATTVDTFKAGDPDTPVTCVAVTMMATQDVLERAAAQDCNLIITHEPTFYSHTDTLTDLTRKHDAVLQAKLDYISSHHLVVWRFHDGWHLHKPDGILLGMTHALGWEDYASKSDPHIFQLPEEEKLPKIAEEVRTKLSTQAMRMAGDSRLRFSKLAILPGAAGAASQISLLERDDVEVLLIGEVPEWETVEYVGDAIRQGRHKALLMLGHIPSEQAGMEECAIWMREFIHDVPVKFVPAREILTSVKH